jgi:putative inorganic carbon (HCO3(-)) transporter
MAFIGLLLYTACVFLRPGEWMPAFANLRIMQIIAIATIILTGLSLPANKEKNYSSPVNLFVIGFFFTAILSHVSNTYLGGAISSAQDFGKNVLVYFLIVFLVNSEKKFNIYSSFLVMLSLVLAVQGIVQANTGVGMGGVTTYQGRIRALGIFNDPNDLALAMVMILPLSLRTLFQDRVFVSKVLNCVFIGIILYAVYLTNSRGGLLALIIMFSYFFGKKSKKLVLGGIIGISLLCIVVFLLSSRLTTVAIDDASAYGRVDAWYQGIQMLKGAPIFGVGYGLFTDYHYREAHNSFISVAAELGFVGLFLFVGIFYNVIRGLNFVAGEKITAEIDSFALQASLIGFCCAAFFLTRAYIVLPYIILALSVSLINISLDLEQKEKLKVTGKDSKIIFGLCILCFILAYIIMK